MAGRTRAKGFALLVVGVCASAPAAADQADAAGPPDAKQACIAAVEQGQTQRDDGKYRQARASFLTCAQDVCPRVVKQSCTKWLRELDESAPTIVVSAKDDQGNDLTDVKVTFDGAPIASQLDGRPLEVDVGEHVLRFDREGSATVEQKLLLRAGEKARVVTVTLKRAEPDGGGEKPATGPEPVMSARHVVAASVALGALAAAGTGVYFLLQSNHDKSTAEGMRAGALSSPNACFNPAASVADQCQALNNAVHSQHDDMNVATGLFIGAGVLAAGAVATWFLFPRAHADEAPATVSVAPLHGGAGFVLSGSF
jgi:hypothetical protein